MGNFLSDIFVLLSRFLPIPLETDISFRQQNTPPGKIGNLDQEVHGHSKK